MTHNNRLEVDFNEISDKEEVVGWSKYFEWPDLGGPITCYDADGNECDGVLGSYMPPVVLVTLDRSTWRDGPV